MRCMHRNKVPFTYAQYLRSDMILDENGIKTGEYEDIYDEPIPYKANICPCTGKSYDSVFGKVLDYDKVIEFDYADPLFDEQTILWIDCEYGEDVPHDYEVRKVAFSRYHQKVAIKKVRDNE